MVDWNDERHPRFDEKYSNLPGAVLPQGESLKMAIQRVIPFWQDTICPAVMDNKKVIVVAHENVLRGIVQTLSGMSNEDILHYNIPTATPFVYEFDRHLNPLRFYYLLGDDLTEEDVLAKEKQVAS
jgi:2,3-bisphosphoglycerate-dependent phosphoglycerate mutase